MKRIIVGISDALDSIYEIDLLGKLSKATNVGTHLVISNWAKKNIKLGTDYSVARVENLADFVYDNRNSDAAAASGSFRIDGVVIAPASMKTVAGVSIGLDEDLVMRAVSAVLKEQRKLILVPRGTPLSAIHLKNLTELAKLGAHIIPPFYDHPKTIQDIVDYQTMKVLNSLNIEADFAKHWDGE